MNKIIGIAALLLLCALATAQPRINIKYQIQKCMDGNTPVQNCCIITDALGQQMYVPCDTLMLQEVYADGDSLCFVFFDTLCVDGVVGGSFADKNFFEDNITGDGLDHTHNQRDKVITIDSVGLFRWFSRNSGFFDDQMNFQQDQFEVFMSGFFDTVNFIVSDVSIYQSAKEGTSLTESTVTPSESRITSLTSGDGSEIIVNPVEVSLQGNNGRYTLGDGAGADIPPSGELTDSILTIRASDGRIRMIDADLLGGGGDEVVSIGDEHEIPYVNALGTDFNYDPRLTYNEASGVLQLNDGLMHIDTRGNATSAVIKFWMDDDDDHVSGLAFYDEIGIQKWGLYNDPTNSKNPFVIARYNNNAVIDLPMQIDTTNGDIILQNRLMINRGSGSEASAELLEIFGRGAGRSRFSIDINTTSGYEGEINITDSGWDFSTNSPSRPFSISPNGVGTIYALASGRVGIIEDNPSATLSVGDRGVGGSELTLDVNTTTAYQGNVILANDGLRIKTNTSSRNLYFGLDTDDRMSIMGGDRIYFNHSEGNDVIPGAEWDNVEGTTNDNYHTWIGGGDFGVGIDESANRYTIARGNNLSDPLFSLAQSDGSIRAPYYDATPPTGTTFGFVTHETDGDFISLSKQAAADTISNYITFADPGGMDSIITCPNGDIGFIEMGDTTCVSVDSFWIVDECTYFIIEGDTAVVCIPEGTPGQNIYNANGTVINTPGGLRLITTDTAEFVWANSSLIRYVEIAGNQQPALQAYNSNSDTRPTLRLNGSQFPTNDIFSQVNGTSTNEDYSYGLDDSKDAFVFSELNYLGDPWWTFYGGQDSSVFEVESTIFQSSDDSNLLKYRTTSGSNEQILHTHEFGGHTGLLSFTETSANTYYTHWGGYRPGVGSEGGLFQYFNAAWSNSQQLTGFSGGLQSIGYIEIEDPTTADTLQQDVFTYQVRGTDGDIVLPEIDISFGSFSAIVGTMYTITNNTPGTLTVHPYGTDQINGVNAAITIDTVKSVIFVAQLVNSTYNWSTVGLHEGEGGGAVADGNGFFTPANSGSTIASGFTAVVTDKLILNPPTLGGIHLLQTSTGFPRIVISNSSLGSSFTGDGLSIGIGNSDDGDITMKDAQDLRFGTSAIERLKIYSNGTLKFNEYDNTLPITGTMYRLLATETDGDVISPTWDDVVDTLAVYGLSGGGGVTDHGALTGLTDDDHPQYALLAGRASGQTLIGGTGTTDDLILRSTAGVGTTGADMVFQVGNNGATEAMRILNAGTIQHNAVTDLDNDVLDKSGDAGTAGQRLESLGGSNAGTNWVSVPLAPIVGHPAESKTNSTTSDQDYTSVGTIPANHLTENKCIRVTLLVTYITGTSTATMSPYLKLGGTKVVTASAAVDLANGITRSGTWIFTIWGTAAAGAAANVETASSPAITGQTNATAQPVALATNGTLNIVPGITYSATGSTESWVVRASTVEFITN